MWAAIIVVAICSTVVGIVAVVMDGVRGMVRSRNPVDPVRTLANRYAAGEIDQSEYSYRLAILMGEAALPPGQEP